MPNVNQFLISTNTNNFTLIEDIPSQTHQITLFDFDIFLDWFQVPHYSPGSIRCHAG